MSPKPPAVCFRILHITDKTICVAHELLIEDEDGVDVVDFCLLHEDQLLYFAYLMRPIPPGPASIPVVSLRTFTASKDSYDLNKVPEVTVRLDGCKDVSGLIGYTSSAL